MPSSSKDKENQGAAGIWLMSVGTVIVIVTLAIILIYSFILIGYNKGGSNTIHEERANTQLRTWSSTYKSLVSGVVLFTVGYMLSGDLYRE